MTKPITVYQFRFGRDPQTGDESWYAIDESGRIICTHVSSGRMFGIHDTGPHGFYSASFPKYRRLIILDDGDFPPDEVMRAAGFTREEEAPTTDAVELTRTFTRLNYPEPEDDGTQLYSMHERVDGEWMRVADGLTLEETDAFVAQHGEWEPTPEPQHRGVDFGWNNDEKRAPMYGSRDEDGM